MADDDIVDPQDELAEETAEDDVEPGDPDPEELEEVEFVADDFDDDDTVAAPDEDEEEDDDEEDTDGPVRRSVPVAPGEEEDDDDDMVTPDDVEADLDTILKDRMVAADEDEEEDDEPEDRTETGDRLQPKRADEQLCPSCFLLVRATAPGCPVGDDDCPIFG